MNHVQPPPCHAAHTPVPSSHLHHHHHPHHSHAHHHQQHQQRLTISPPSQCLLPACQSPLVLGNNTSSSSGDVMSVGPNSDLCSNSVVEGKELMSPKNSQQHPHRLPSVYSTGSSPHVTSPTAADVSPTVLDRFRQHRHQYPPPVQHRISSSSTPPCSLAPVRLLPSTVGFTVKPEYTQTSAAVATTTTTSSSSPCQSPLSCTTGGGNRPQTNTGSLPLHVICTSAGTGRGHLSSGDAQVTQFRKCEVLTDEDTNNNNTDYYYDEDDDYDDDDDEDVGFDEEEEDESPARRRSQDDCPSSHQALHYHPQSQNSAGMVATDLRTTPSSASSMMASVGPPEPLSSQQLSLDYTNNNNSSAGISSSGPANLLSGVPLLSHAQYPPPPSVQLARQQQQRDSFSTASIISPGSHELPGPAAGSSGPPSSQGMPTDFDLVVEQHQLLPHHQQHPANQTFSGISLLPITTSELTPRGLSRDHFYAAAVAAATMGGVPKARRYSLPYELLTAASDGGAPGGVASVMSANNDTGLLKLPVNPGGSLEMLERCCGAQISPASSSVVTKSGGGGGGGPTNGILTDEAGHTPTNTGNQLRLGQPLDFTSFHQQHHGSSNNGALVVNGSTSRCFSTPTVVPLLGMGSVGRGATAGGDEHAMHVEFEHHHHQQQHQPCQSEVPLPGFSSPESAFYQYQHRMEGQRCQVCGELAAGFHHGAYVCEACKKFFMRHSLTDTKPTNVCPTGGKCVVAKGSRGKCQICRFRKCLLVGMRMKDPDSQPEVDISNIPCRVCGGRSSGFHFGALTCEGCKGFFRRTEGSAGSLVCVGGQNACTITPRSRNACKSCRFRRCLAAGMSKKGSRIGRQPNAVKFHCAIEIRQLQSNRGKLTLHHPLSGDCITKPSSSSNSTPWVGVGGGGYPSSDLLTFSRASSLQHCLLPSTADVDDNEGDDGAGANIEDEEIDDVIEEQQQQASLLPLGFSQPQQLIPAAHQSPWQITGSSAVSPTILGGTSGFLGDQKPPPVAPTNPPARASLFLLLPPTASQQLLMTAVPTATAPSLHAVATVSTARSRSNPSATSSCSTSVSPVPGRVLLQSVQAKDEPTTPGSDKYPMRKESCRIDSGSGSGIDNRDLELNNQHQHGQEGQEEEEDMLVGGKEDVGCVSGFRQPLAVCQDPTDNNSISCSTSAAAAVPSLLAPFGYYYRHYCQQQQQPMDWGPGSRLPVTSSPFVAEEEEQQQQSITVHHHRQQQQQAAVTAQLIASLARQLTDNDVERGSDEEAGRRELTSASPPSQEAVLRFSDGMRTATEFLRLPNTYFKNRFRMTSIPLDREESSCRIWGHMMNHFHMHAQQVVQFAKLVPGFNQLGITARSSLVRGGMYPAVLLLLSRDYRPESDEYNYFDFTSEERTVIMHHFPTFIRFTEHLRMAGLLLHHLGLSLPELSLASAVEILRNFHILEEPTRASTKELFVLAYHTLHTCITHRNSLLSSTCRSGSGVGDQHRWEQFLALSRMIQEMNREHHQVLASLKESRSDLYFPELYIEMFQLADSASAFFASAAAAGCPLSASSSLASAKAAVVSSTACSTAVAALRLCTTSTGGSGDTVPSSSEQQSGYPRLSEEGTSSATGSGMGSAQVPKRTAPVPACPHLSS